MSINIVQLNVSQTIGEAPITLQQTGAIISTGSTTTQPNTLSLITQYSDWTNIQRQPTPISTITWSSGTVTVTVGQPHGLPVGDTFYMFITGCVPTGYNATVLCTITTTTQFTYVLNNNPGVATILGFYLLVNNTEVTQMVSTYFAQGSSNSIYILELGACDAGDGCAALNTWINNNPKKVYIFLLPIEWDAIAPNSPILTTLFPQHNSDTALTYFCVTTGASTYTNYSGQTASKCAYVQAQAPSPSPDEFSSAATIWDMLNYNPSDTNKVAPLCFQFVSGVTPYPTSGIVNGVQALTLLQQFKTANINYISTAAEGGNSNTMLVWGNMLDGNPFNYWYAVDWVQINLDEDLSNEIINGSNNPINPLYYDQPGINRLQARAQATMQRGITFGMVLGPVTVNAIPFSTYVTDNPEDYTAGIYRGLSVSFTPQRGFEQIVFNLNVTAFPTSST